MNSQKSLKILVKEAKNGNRKSMQSLIEKYSYLIQKHSTIDNHFCEDCKQQIILNCVLGIGKFDLTK